MKLKSLLLGSAAALFAFTGARAADAVIAEPEPVEYVRICDAYGAGFFYIPGTETCLKIGGFVRYDININEEGWQKNTTSEINFDARSDTEMGILRSYISLRARAFGNGSNQDPIVVGDKEINGLNRDGAFIEEAFIQLGGLTIGTALDYFDSNGIGGELDQLGGARVNLIGYTYAANGANFSVALVDDNDDIDVVGDPDDDSDFTPNLQATAGFEAGPAKFQGVVAYDNDTEEFAGKLVAKFAVIEGGSLDVAAVYASGATYTYRLAEWSVAASYNQKFSDTIKASVGVQYWSDRNFDGAGSPNRIDVGANVDWTPVKNFLVRGQIAYSDDEQTGFEGYTGRIRFQRSF